MKKFALFVIGIVVCFSCSIKADTVNFNYLYQGEDGISASGMLSGVPMGAGEYQIVSGSIDVAGNTPLAGTGTFAPNTGSGVFQTGGGTEFVLSGTDSNLFFPGAQYLDNAGLVLFRMSTGLGLGLFSNGPAAGYGLFGGNWQLNDTGNLSVSTTPEPASLFLLGTGCSFMAAILFFKRKNVGNAA